MGGRGSGQWAGWGRETCDDRLRLDVRALVRDMRHELPGSLFTSTWTERVRSIVLGSVGARLDLDARVLVLLYESHGTPVENRVRLDTTAPYFGGVRWWARCPGCGARVALLYFDVTAFRCRGCANLAYTSTRESALVRAARRARKLEERLARRAWWSTRARLVARVEAAYEAMSDMLEEP